MKPERPHRRVHLSDGWLALTCLIVGLILIFVCGSSLATPGAPRLTLDLIGLALSGLVLSCAVGARSERAARIAPPRGDRTSGPSLAGLALLLLGATAGGQAAWVLWLDRTEWKAALPWWLAGLLLVLAGALVIDVQSKRLSPLRPSASSGAAVLGALGVGLLAIFLRTYRLDEVPPGLFVDETNSALDALAILWGAPTSPFGTGWYETPNGYIYVQAAFIGLFGPTFLALKLPGIIMGVLAVLGVYFLGRLLFGTPVGLVAGLFMAFARWPLTMSRWGWNENAPPVAHVWTIYFVVRGARSGRATDFAVAGLVMGLGMYTYLSIRLVVIAVAGYLVYRAIVEPGFLHRHLGRLALFGAVWAVTFAPLAITYVQDPQTFLNRSHEVTIERDVEQAGGTLDPVLENIRRHLQMFNVAGDRNPRHNVPDMPMLDPVMGALLVPAAVRALTRSLDHRWGLLLLWIPAILLGGVLSLLVEGPQAYRTMGVTAAVAILCGELLAGVGQRLSELLARLRLPNIAAAGLPALGVAGVLAASGWANYRAYFVDYATDPRVYAAFNQLETSLVHELTSARDLDAYYLSAPLAHFSPVRYFTASSFGLDVGGRPSPPYHELRGLDDLPLPANGRKDLVLIWGPEWSSLTGVIRLLYPNLSVQQVPNRTGGILYEKVTIPAEDLQAVQGLPATRHWSDGRTDQVRVVDPALGLPGAYGRAEWVGGLYVPASGARTVWATDGSTVLVDGQVATTPVFLPKGLHRLEVAQSGEQARTGLHLLWSDSPASPAEPVPAANFYAWPWAVTNGLLGTYYRAEGWDGPPLFRRVDSMILFAWSGREPVEGPFGVSWQGDLEAAVAGPYIFLVDADDGARLWLYDQLVGESMNLNTRSFFEVRLDLPVGRHPIRLDYVQLGGAKAINLRWIPPGQPQTLVPTEVLRPATP